MAKRKGTVSKIGKSKYSFYILLDGDDFYFNTKYEPKCGEGDVVGIEFDKKGDNRGQIKKVKLLEDNGGPKGLQQKPASNNSYKADPDRQASIVFQSSRKDALVAAELLVTNAAIALPKPADKRRTVIEELIDELTLKFFKAASDPAAATKTAKDAEEDADEDWDDNNSESEEDWDDEWD